MTNQYETINSLTQYPSIAQIFTYIYTSLQIITFYVIIQNRLQNYTAYITLHILFATFLSIQLISSIITSVSDPSDQLMIRFRNKQLLKDDNLEEKVYCDLCNSFVETNSKHCKICSRCVVDYDHHCQWINNCIGKKNYKEFIIMIIFTFCTMILYIVGVGILWTEYQWRQYLAEMIVIWVVALLSLVLSFMLINLIGFHIYLMARGLNTYQFMVQVKKNTNSNKIHNMSDNLNKKNTNINQNDNKTTLETQQRANSNLNLLLMKTRNKQKQTIKQAANQEQQEQNNSNIAVDYIGHNSQHAKSLNDDVLFENKKQEKTGQYFHQNHANMQRQDHDQNGKHKYGKIDKYFMKSKTIKLCAGQDLDNVLLSQSIKVEGSASKIGGTIIQISRKNSSKMNENVQ